MRKAMKPGRQYFIINMDEPYAEEIYAVLKRGQQEKGQWPEGDIDFSEWKKQTFREAPKAASVQRSRCETCIGQSLEHCPYWSGYKASMTCDQYRPKAASQSADVFAYKLQEFAKSLEVPLIGSITEAVRFYESATKAERDAWIPLIESAFAAQRQAGREEAFRHYGMISTYPNLPDGDERKKAYFCGVSDASTRHAALVEAATKALRKLRAYVGVCSGDKELIQSIIPGLDKAMSGLDKSRKG